MIYSTNAFTSTPTTIAAIIIVPRIGNLLAKFAFASIAFWLALYSAVPLVKSFLTSVCTFSPNANSTPSATKVTATGNKSFRSIFFFPP